METINIAGLTWKLSQNGQFWTALFYADFALDVAYLKGGKYQMSCPVFTEIKICSSLEIAMRRAVIILHERLKLVTKSVSTAAAAVMVETERERNKKARK